MRVEIDKKFAALTGEDVPTAVLVEMSSQNCERFEPLKGDENDRR
jgi:hypothetical protein